MSGHPLPPRDRYALRNDPNDRFKIRSSASGEGVAGSTMRAKVTRERDGLTFRVEVVFQGEYASTKANFTTDMYHETALSILRSQLESHVYRDTRVTLEVNSGLPRTQVGVQLGWDEPE
jgi:hypothetical protein